MAKDIVKFRKFSNDERDALALDKIKFDSNTNTLTLYSSLDASIKEEATIPVSEVELDTQLETRGKAADAKAVGDAVRSVKAMIGAPLTASQASDMVDNTKIYVYTGNEEGYQTGHWYYYNGNTWVDGGSYNASAYETDKTLSIADKPADAKAVGNALDNINEDIDDIKEELVDYINKKAVNGLLYENNFLSLTADGEPVGEPVEIKGGSGGGGGDGENAAIMTAQNTTGWLSKTISYGQSISLSITWSSTEDGISTGDGTLTVYVGGSIKTTMNVKQGNVVLEVSDYLSIGSNNVRLRVTDVYGNYRIINYTINAMSLTISSNFDASGTFTVGEPIQYTYTPVGAVSKTVDFIIDGSSIGTSVVTTSGRQQTKAIQNLTHGAHSLLVYFEAEVDGEIVRSNELYYELIVVNSLFPNPIISTTFRQTTAVQFATLTIPYRVYTPNSLSSEVTLSANGGQIATLTINRDEQIWTYRPDNVGTLILTIATGDTHRDIELTITQSDIDVEAETDALALYLTSYGGSNNKPDPSKWEDTEHRISARLTNFNFVSDGWLTDKDGVTVLRIAGDARVVIPYKPFANDFRATGKTIEIEFATRNILNYNATIISCMSGGRGFQLTAQKAQISSEQRSISTQYKEDEHVRISFVVEKRTEYRLLYIYINGIMSGVVQYPDDDDFSQTNPVDISIGSNEVTTDIYCIRVYDNNLTRYQILDNWIADTQDITTKIARYNHNNIYDEYGAITIENLPKDLPYMVLEAPELPQYKGDKKNVNGYFVNPLDPSKSFGFTNAQADVQGTSSQFYARKNYKIKYKNGFDMTSSGEHVDDYMLTDGTIPTNTFTFKADVASSEGANNVELVRLYNDACPYKTPPQKTDNRVRQGIDGFPIVIFWNDGQNVTFVGKYNANHDKGTPEVFGFEDGDESWETLNNSGVWALWQSADYSGNGWLSDFEARYPEDNTNPTSLQALAAWIVTTDQSKATGNALSQSYTDVDGNVHTVDNAAYRLAKFRTEAHNYMELDSVLFYYLFTELFLMVDSRAKNAFPSFLGGDKWCFLPYDMDTAIGIDNQGTLTYGYSLEDTDYIGTEPVYNGQNSVLWVNVREAFYEELSEMYSELRSSGAISYEKTEQMFEEHQNKWCEAIFNEDAWFKYIDPLIEDNNADYLEMALGSKAEQRKWWLYNRFRYIDSKYSAGSTLTDYIRIRPGAVDSAITITPYADLYASIKWDNDIAMAKAMAGNPVSIPCPYTQVGNNVVTILNASQLASVGDLSGFKCRTADFSMASRLQYIKVGDNASGYTNPNLLELNVGNNPLLGTVDARNCTSLATPIDLSGASNVEYVYFDGTQVTSVALPIGGILKVLHLPSSITNLTIRNQPSITNLTVGSYNNISTLRLENVPTLDTKAILRAIPSESRVRLIGFNWEATGSEEIEELLNILDGMRGLDENGNNTEKAQVSGTIHTATLTGSQIASYNQRYPYLTITADHTTSILRYYTYDGLTLLYTETVLDGGDGAYDGQPIRPADDRYTYTFAGWTTTPYANVEEDATKQIIADRTVYAAYEADGQKYIVRFYNGTTLLQTVYNVLYGGTAVYTGTTPRHPKEPDYFEFRGWSPSNTNITATTNCYAQYTDLRNDLMKYLSGTLENYVSETNIDKIAQNAFSDLNSLRTIATPVTLVETNAFDGQTGLTTADFTNTSPVTIQANAMGVSTLENLFLRSETVSALSNINGIAPSKIAAGVGGIYVPSSLLEDYKIESNWSWYADSIYPIGSYPVTDFSSISDSWAEIIASIDNGTYATKYKLGDTKKLTINGYEVYMQIVAFDADVLEDGTTTVPITFLMRGSAYTAPMNATGTTSGGWAESSMRSDLINNVLPTIGEPVVSRIKPVKKTYYNANTQSTLSVVDKLWLPSYREMVGRNTYEDSGVIYTSFFDTPTKRVKYNINTGNAVGWWLRSAYNTSRFWNVQSTGGLQDGLGANRNDDIAIGFCLG